MKKNIIVLFDLDGLMIDSERLYLDIMINFNKLKGYPITKDFYIKNCLGKDRVQITNELKKIWDNNINFDEYWNELLCYREAFLVKVKIKQKKGFSKLLNYFKQQGVRIGIVSSSSIKMINYLLKKTKININDFDKIFSKESVENVKPYPDLYLLAKKYFNVCSENVYAIEDSDVGIKAAYAAGLKAILVPDLMLNYDEIKEKIYLKFDSLDDVLSYFKNNF